MTENGSGAGNASPQVYEKFNFLIVEDNFDMSMVIKERLQRLSPPSESTVVKTSLAAQKFLYKKRVDLIFLDLNLDDSYGIESVREIMPYARNAPVVVLTGMANDITIEEAIKAGAKELVLKTNLSKQRMADILEKYTTFIAPVQPAPPVPEPEGAEEAVAAEESEEKKKEA